MKKKAKEKTWTPTTWACGKLLIEQETIKVDDVEKPSFTLLASLVEQ